MTDAAPPRSRRATIIRNPGARRPPSDRGLADAIEAIRPAGWTASLQNTTARGDATRLAARAASDGVDVVVACGGDGTLNEVANGLIGSDTALAVLPGGTANVWAREIGVTSDPVAALGLLEAGRRVRVDTGVARIGDEEPRRFILMCSAGIDAGAVAAVERQPRMKRRLGRAAFGWPSLRAIGSRAVKTVLTVNDEERILPLLMVVAGNTRLYGSVLRIANDAVMDDGQLDLVTFEDAVGPIHRHAIRRTSVVVRALRGSLRAAHAEGIRYVRTPEAELRPTDDLPVQADGEFIGTAGPDAPLRLSIAPGSLTMLVPGGVNPLFGQTGSLESGVNTPSES